MKTLKLITLLVIMAVPFSSLKAEQATQSKITIDVAIDDVNEGVTAFIENRENKEVTLALTVKDADGSVVMTRKFVMAPLSSIEYKCEFDLDPTMQYTTEVEVEGSDEEPKVDGTTLLNGFRYITGRYYR